MKSIVASRQGDGEPAPATKAQEQPPGKVPLSSLSRHERHRLEALRRQQQRRCSAA